MQRVKKSAETYLAFRCFSIDSSQRNGRCLQIFPDLCDDDGLHAKVSFEICDILTAILPALSVLVESVQPKATCENFIGSVDQKTHILTMYQHQDEGTQHMHSYDTFERPSHEKISREKKSQRLRRVEKKSQRKPRLADFIHYHDIIRD